MIKRSLLGTNTLVIAGGTLLIGGLVLLLVFGVGYHHEGVLVAFLGVLSRPAIIIGLMLIVLGPVRKMQPGSLRWLRITLTVLCSSVVIIVGLYTLFASVLLFSGF